MTWNYAYTPSIWPSVFTVLLLITVSVLAWRRRSVPGALPFTIGCLFAASWAAGSIMEIAAVDVPAKILWFKFQGLFQLPVASAITCFILEYAWPGRWLSRRNQVLLAVPPLLILGLVLTDDLHHLVWRSFAFDGSVLLHWGPLSWFFLAYSYGLALVNIIVFIWLFLRSPQHRWPVVVMLIGMIGAQVIYLIDRIPVLRSELPLDMLGLAFAFLMYAIALFTFRLFDPIPLARQTVIEQLHAGMLVLDSQGRVASLNPAAERILGVPASYVKGRPARELLPFYPDKQAVPDGTETEFSLGTGQKVSGQEIAGQDVQRHPVRHYTMAISPLKDWRGLGVGHLLLLRDVTEQKQAQAQIVAQQRALAMLHERERLARELHDSLGQVFAFVNAQGQAVRRLLSRGDISTAEAYVDRLVEASHEADVDIRESILSLRAALSEQKFFAVLEHYLARYEKNYGIQAGLEKPDTIPDGAFEPLVEVQLLRILQEALTNVRKHAAAKNVRVIFALEDGCARITVQDDGQGFDPAMLDAGSNGRVGLRVMRERAEEVEGILSLYSEPGQGTRVIVRVPLKEGRRGDGREGDLVKERQEDGAGHA